MTVASTSTRELDITTLLQRAYQLATMMPIEQGASGAQWEARAAFGRDMLEMTVDNLQAEGLLTRDVETYDVTLTDGTAAYTLPATTIRVVGNAMYQSASGQPWFPVRAMDREEFLAIADKTSEGSPTRYYQARTGTVVLNLWQIPDTTGATLRVQRQKLLADNNVGTATVDLERSWSKYLLWELAHHFAVSGGIEVQRCGYLHSKATDILKVCKRTTSQSLPSQMVLDHDGGVR